MAKQIFLSYALPSGTTNVYNESDIKNDNFRVEYDESNNRVNW